MKKTISVLAAAASTLALGSALPAAHAAAHTTADTTQLTVRLNGCDDCIVGAASYLDDTQNVWSANPRKAKAGVVTFAVPTQVTTGLSITVRAPWEGATGYVTNVAVRYRGYAAGDRVGFQKARAATKASGCWAGTADDAATIKVNVRKVQVEGYGGKVPGTLAWTPITQDWLRPVIHAWHGVLGTQDVMPCKAP